MSRTFEDFKKFHHEDCGMPLTEDGAVICVECQEPIYESDYSYWDWSICPCCTYNLLTDCFEEDEDSNVCDDCGEFGIHCTCGKEESEDEE